MDQLEKLLALPEECRPGPQGSEPGTIERALSDASEVVVGEAEQKLIEMIVHLIEQPCYRLAGAEEALRQFCMTVEQTLQGTHNGLFVEAVEHLPPLLADAHQAGAAQDVQVVRHGRSAERDAIRDVSHV